MILGTVRSLNAGRPKTLHLMGGDKMRSAVRKEPMLGPQSIGPDGLPGDGSQERMHHLPEMALHAFSLDRYPELETLLGTQLPIPAFGENLSTDGATEDSVCVGDLVQLGTTILRVSQPTIRCAKLGRNLGLPTLLREIEATGACGFYLGVVEPGETAMDDALELLERPSEGFTIARLHAAMFRGGDEPEAILALPHLGPRWATSYRKRLRMA